MSEPAEPPRPLPEHTPARLRVTAPATEAVVCERCGGANVYRMHAVWRCADCGYKTDCCGW
jgi:hypothetical protein